MSAITTTPAGASPMSSGHWQRMNQKMPDSAHASTRAAQIGGQPASTAARYPRRARCPAPSTPSLVLPPRAAMPPTGTHRPTAGRAATAASVSAASRSARLVAACYALLVSCCQVDCCKCCCKDSRSRGISQILHRASRVYGDTLDRGAAHWPGHVFTAVARRARGRGRRSRVVGGCQWE